MFENEDFGNQTESVESYETESYETNEPESVEPVTTQEEEYDVIRYNKEEVKIPVSERQTYLQKGYNYDKVQQQLEQTRQEAAYLDRLAQMSGYQDKHSFLQAVEEAEQQRQYETYANQMGIDVDAYQQHIAPVFNEVQQLRNELQSVQQQKLLGDLQGQIQNLRNNYPDFDEYQDQVYQIATNKGYDLEDAYILASYKNKLSNVERSTEQRTVQQIKSRQGKHVETSDNNTNLDLGLSPEELRVAQNMGISPEDYAKWK